MYFKYFIFLSVNLFIFWTPIGAYEIINGTEQKLLPKIADLEFFDDCQELGPPFEYCVFEIQVSPLQNVTTSRVWKIIQLINEDPVNIRRDIIEKGRCIDANQFPNRSELVHFYKNKFNQEYLNDGLEVKIEQVSCNKFDRKFDVYDKIGLAIFLSIFLFVIICTELDVIYFKEKSKENLSTVVKILQCFSLRINWTKIFSITNNSKPEFRYVQGIRFLTIALIIYGHNLMTSVNSPIMNASFFDKICHWPTKTILFQGPLIVQTFFLLSGLFFGIPFFKIIFKQRFHFKIFASALINRYIRLTPSFAIVTLFNATILYHIGNGAFWEKNIGSDRRNCRNNWWANIIYVANELESDKMCMITSWFVAADFQLFLFSLCLFALMWFNKNRIKWILAFCFVLSMIIPGVITYVLKLQPFPLNFPRTLRLTLAGDETFKWTYLKAYTNASSYILGLIIAYMFYTGHIKKIPFNRSKLFIAFLDPIAYISIFSVFIGSMYFYSENYVYNRILATIVASVYKILAVVPVAIIIYGASLGGKSATLTLLSWKVFVILGRLSFSMYVVHWPILRIHASLAPLPVYYGFYYSHMLQYITALVITIVMAAVLALFVEYPVTNLFNLLVKSNMKNDKSQEQICGKQETTDKNVDLSKNKVKNSTGIIFSDHVSVKIIENTSSKDVNCTAN